MAVSDSLALSSPYGKPPTSKHEEWRARVLERGSTLAPCPECGTEAERETPCYTFRPGLRWVVTVYRCPTCGVVKQTEAAPEEPEVREEPVPMSTKGLTLPYITLPPECECGCGSPVTRNACKPDAWNRYAGPKCSKRVWNAKRATVKPPVIVDMAGNHTVTLPTAAPAPASLLGVVKAYLRKLTPDGRAALLELVYQEEHVERLAQRAADLGVA